MGSEYRGGSAGDARTSDGILIEAAGPGAGCGHLALLHQVDLHVRADEVVALVEPNAAAKTMLSLADTPMMAGSPSTS